MSVWLWEDLLLTGAAAAAAAVFAVCLQGTSEPVRDGNICTSGLLLLQCAAGRVQQAHQFPAARCDDARVTRCKTGGAPLCRGVNTLVLVCLCEFIQWLVLFCCCVFVLAVWPAEYCTATVVWRRRRRPLRGSLGHTDECDGVLAEAMTDREHGC